MLQALHDKGDVGGKSKEFLDAVSIKMVDMDSVEMAQYVKSCVGVPAHTSGQYKVILGLAHEEWRHGIIRCFKEMRGCEYRPGRPPASGLEDEASKWFEALSIA